MKKKRISKLNSFAVIILIISFLVGFCGVGTLFVDKNDYQQTEQISTLADNPANVIPEKEPVVDSGNYTVKTWDEKLEEMFDNGQDFDFVGSGSASDPYKISTAEELALVSYLSNNGGVYPMLDDITKIPGYLEDQTNKIVPEGYIQLEFIESSGSQYVDTEVLISSKTRVEIDTKSTAAYSVFGGSGSGSTMFNLNGNNRTRSFRWGNQSWNGSGISYQTRYLIDFSNKIYVNGELKREFTYSDWTTNCKLVLFARNENNNGGISLADHSGKVTIYSCKIYDNETLIRNLIPACREVDLACGLYDIENNVFYTNKGSGRFNAYKTLAISGKTFELTNDIYLNDGKLGLNETTDESGNVTYTPAYEDGGDGIFYQWTPIALSEESYLGGHGLAIAIYGKNKIISGMYINSTKRNLGLISGWGHYSWGADSGGQYMEKVHMKNTLVYAPESSGVGGLIAYPTCGRINDCSFDGYLLGKSVVAPVGSVYNAAISGFTNYGKIIALNGDGCGIGSQNISSSINYGEVIASGVAAGISLSINVNNCINYGKVTSTTSSAYGISTRGSNDSINYGDVIGKGWLTCGIAGENATKCINYGNVDGAGIACGIVGASNSKVVIDCINYGNITAKKTAIGIARDTTTCINNKNYGDVISLEGTASGLYYGTVKGYNSANFGNIKAKTYAGGVAATITSSVILSGCQNEGKVLSESNVAGGITGIISDGEANANIINCINLGKVVSKTNAGGLVGSITGGSTIIEACTNEGKVSGQTATGFIGKETSLCTMKNCLNNGDIESSTFEEPYLKNTFGITTINNIENCITSSKVNGNKVNACIYVKDGYFNQNYRTGKITSKNANHNAIFQGIIDSEFIKNNNFIDFTPVPVADFKSQYTELEYIESTGTQYIDTGGVMGDNIEVQVGFQ